MTDLFAQAQVSPPLAQVLRPADLSEVLGQEHLLNPNGPLAGLFQSKRLHSMVLYGPPGSGKTTLAHLLCQQINGHFESLIATTCGVKDIKLLAESAKGYHLQGKVTVLFLDEIHRFSKSQQDSLLPHIEAGTFVLIGATTENPSFSLNRALLSRTRIHTLNALQDESLNHLIDKALTHQQKETGLSLEIQEEARQTLVTCAQGDGRYLLNMLESVFSTLENQNNTTIDAALLKRLLPERTAQFNRAGQSDYAMLSAFYKSIRGSDPDAALYWLSRMLIGGADPNEMARALVRVASEDIGNADPRALHLAHDAWQTLDRLGLPWGELALAHATTYCACAAKSNAVYMAFKKAKAEAQMHCDKPVPEYLQNASTSATKEQNLGHGYRYPHDEPGAFAAGVRYLPDGVNGGYYLPTERGLEAQIREKLKRLRALDSGAI